MDAQKTKMMDYIANNLWQQYKSITPKEKRIVDEYPSRYIVVDDKKVLFLADREYAVKDINFWHQKVSRDYGMDIGVIMLKNGKDYFVSGAATYHSRHSDGIPQPYDNKQINRMIALNDLEKFFSDNSSEITYYQPESKKLEEGIIKYKFEKIDEDIPYTFLQKKMYIWTENSFMKKIALENGKIIPAPLPVLH